MYLISTSYSDYAEYSYRIFAISPGYCNTLASAKINFSSSEVFTVDLKVELTMIHVFFSGIDKYKRDSICMILNYNGNDLLLRNNSAILNHIAQQRLNIENKLF